MKLAQSLLATFLTLVAVLPAVKAQTFEVAEASIADEQKAMAEGRTTSKALVQAYLRRIEAFDLHGPRLNALIALNPNAISEAEALDRERAAKGPRGPLHGIPVIVKDNYGTADLPTTAGSLALLGFIPAQDAFQVRKLREAGAVIVGKSNLHELAAGITTISSAGGQTLNPYDPQRNPGGSSGGTGAAIAASFAAAGMGSDTCGSIRIPASQNNLVGLRPTKGLSSIAGIVPLSVTQDVGGPLARTAEDLAMMLDATIGEDPADRATHLRPGQIRPQFVDALNAGTLKGARIGTLEPLFGDATDDRDVIRIVRDAVNEMKQQGAEVIPLAMPELNAAINGTSLIDLEFKEDLAKYFAENSNAPVHSLNEIVDRGLLHASLEATFKRRLESPGRNSDAYRRALEKRAELARTILKVMDDQKLDALVYPTMKRKPARIGDPQGGSNCQLSASVGYPALSMPAGFTADGLPVGVELLGRPLDDAKLVAYAYSYESAAHHRKAPALTPALGARTVPALLTWRSSSEGVTAAFSFDPATNQLSYSIAGLGQEQLLAATIHRGTTDQSGPAILVLSTHPFAKLDGAQTIPGAEREKLMSGELYLRVVRRAGREEIRIPVAPKPTMRQPR